MKSRDYFACNVSQIYVTPPTCQPKKQIKRNKKYDKKKENIKIKLRVGLTLSFIILTTTYIIATLYLKKHSIPYGVQFLHCQNTGMIKQSLSKPRI